jgi:tetratricopeptide (TPR) repeat protein
MSYSEQLLEKLEQGEMDDVSTLFTQVLANDDDETKFNLAEELYAYGFTGYAKRLYQELAGKYPDETSVLTALADIAVADGDTDKALDYLSRVSADDPNYEQALLATADVYQTLGLYEVSEQKLLEAQRLDPEEPVIGFALGELEFAWGHFEAAAAAYLALLQQGVDNVADVAVKLRYAASLANTGRYEDAVSVYAEYGELPIADRFQLGALYLQLKDYQKAVDTLQAVVDQDSSFTNAYLPLARAERENGTPELALKTVQAGLAYDDTNEDLFAIGAQLALSFGDNELGEKYLQSALGLDPENQHSILAWSNFLIAQNRHEENSEFLKDLDDNGASDPQLYWNLARSQAALEDYDAARANYLLAFRTFQDRPEFLRDIAAFFRTTAAKAEEEAALQRLTALEPDDYEAQERLDELKGNQY